MKNISTIIWDWNGTLLDDVDLCIESINHLLSGRKQPSLSRSVYRNIFTFPVKNYYELAGFNFEDEPFDDVAVEFIGLYKEKIMHCTVFPEAKQALAWFTANGYSQYLISAMEHQFLMELLHSFEISQFFDGFSGITDHLAHGKMTMARDFIHQRGIDPSTTLFVGDTLHDFEVAQNLGMRCLLVAGGHQSEFRLMRSGCEVVTSLPDVVAKFNPSSLEGSGNNKNRCA